MHRYNYGFVIIATWMVFITIWLVSALWAKRDAPAGSRGRTAFWFWRAAVILLVLVLFKTGKHSHDVFGSRLFHLGVTPGWIGAALTVAGIGFAIWARAYLGRNWSTHPTRKENHELVVSGPYAFVRHPIYSGIILALLGGVLTGDTIAIALFVVVSVMFFQRISKEERIMLELFPDKYPAYQARTKRLVPFVW